MHNRNKMPVLNGLTWTWHGFPYAYSHNVNSKDILITGGVDVFSQKVVSYDFNTGEIREKILSETLGIDDHNMVASCYSGGRLITFYVGHNQQNRINYRVNENNVDVRQLGEERTIETNGVASYLSVLSYQNHIYIITRVGVDKWCAFYSGDAGETWSGEMQISTEPRSDGANYVNAGKRSIQDSRAGICFAGHGGWAEGNYAINFFDLDLPSGELKTVDGIVVGNMQTGSGLPLNRNEGTLFYDGSKNATIQNTLGFQVASGRTPIISYLTYAEDFSTADYEIAYYDDEIGEVVNVIVEQGVKGHLMKETHPHQFGGFQLVGVDNSYKRCSLALSKYNEDSEKWEIWRYFSEDLTAGKWNKEKVDESDNKLIRPVSVYNRSHQNPVKFLWLAGFINIFINDFATDVKTILTQ